MLENRSLQVQTLIDISEGLKNYHYSPSNLYICIWLLQLVLVNPVGNVMEKLHTSKILDSFGLRGVYLTVGEAVADITSSGKAQPWFSINGVLAQKKEIL